MSYKKNTFGFSYQLNEYLNNKLWEIEETYNKYLSDILEKNNYDVISIGTKGNYLDGSLEIEIKILKHQGETITKCFTPHVDDSALEIYQDHLIAYFGPDRESDIKELFEALYNGDDLEELEPELWNQLAEDYSLDSLANKYSGAEFLECDKEQIMKLFNLK